MKTKKLIDALCYRLFWLKYGVTFFRSSDLRIGRVKIGQKRIKLSIPPGEEDVMKYEFINIFYNDCYGLKAIEGKVSNILDIGGNMGYFALAARSHFPDARIHSYEPNPSIQEHLLNNTNSLSIDIYPEAIGAGAGFVDLKKVTGGSLYSTSVPSESGKIKMTAMATAVARLGGTVDLLKMDCEGAEWGLFEEKVLWKHINRLTMEYHLWANPQMDVPEIIKIIKGLGFRITYLNEAPELKSGILHAAKF